MIDKSSMPGENRHPIPPDQQPEPSELQLKTSSCQGGCGVRYCSKECQAQGWRDGPRLSCRRLRERRRAGAGACVLAEGVAEGDAKNV